MLTIMLGLIFICSDLATITRCPILTGVLHYKNAELHLDSTSCILNILYLKYMQPPKSFHIRTAVDLFTEIISDVRACINPYNSSKIPLLHAMEL